MQRPFQLAICIDFVPIVCTLFVTKIMFQAVFSLNFTSFVQFVATFFVYM